MLSIHYLDVQSIYLLIFLSLCTFKGLGELKGFHWQNLLFCLKKHTHLGQIDCVLLCESADYNKMLRCPVYWLVFLF